jgi:hypothetical protein
MDPVTALMVASSAMQAVGQIQQGKAAEQQAEYDAAVSRRNAKVMEMQAAVEGQQAARAEEKQRRAGRKVMGEQAAGLALSGVGFSGTALDLTEESARNIEMDALNIRYEGQLKAQGLMADAESQRYKAEGQIFAGKQAKAASKIGAASALLSGGAGIAKYKAGIG